LLVQRGERKKGGREKREGSTEPSSDKQSKGEGKLLYLLKWKEEKKKGGESLGKKKTRLIFPLLRAKKREKKIFPYS